MAARKLDNFTGQVAQLAATLYDVPVLELFNANRQHEIVRVRNAVFRVLREVRGWSFPVIAKLVGDKDHTTVMWGIQRCEHWCFHDEEYRKRYELLLAEASSLRNLIRRKAFVEYRSEHLPERITTPTVCELAGYTAQTLRKRIEMGRMPPPIDKTNTMIFRRDDVLVALGLIDKPTLEEQPQW
jgi:hypothetical protein